MSDNYNNGTPDPQQKQVDFLLEEDKEPSNNVGTIFMGFKDHLESRGFLMKLDPLGRYAYHSIYKLIHPSNKDIRYPANFKVFQKLQTPSHLIEFGDILLDYLKQFAKKSDEYLILSKLQTGGIRSMAGSWAALQIEAEKARRVNNPAPEHLRLSPRPLLSKDPSIRSLREYAPIAYLPLEDWFPESVKGVTIHDILCLFPEAERHLLALIMGRTVVGKSNHIPPGWDKPIKHTSRMMAIILGEDPGLGKSALFDFISDALRSVGYRIQTFSSMDKTFNLGEVVLSDFIYKDDITDKSLKSFLGSENAKPVISSTGHLRVENKGEQAYNVAPQGTIVINCNNFNPNLVYELDPGMKDRVHILSTYREVEIDELQMGGLSSDSPCYKPSFHIPWLAEKLGVQVNTLMLWFLRKCADYFLDNIEVKEIGVNPLEELVGRWSLNLRYQININEMGCILSLLATMARIQGQFVKSEKGQKPLRDVQLQDINFYEAMSGVLRLYIDTNYQPFLHSLKDHYDRVDLKYKEVHPWRGFMVIDPQSLANCYNLYDRDSVDSLATFSSSMTLVRNRKGMSYTDKLIYWTQGWNKIKYSLEANLLEIHKRFIKNTWHNSQRMIYTSISPSVKGWYYYPELLEEFKNLQSVKPLCNEYGEPWE